jgi:hypothetical protein
MSLQSGRLHDGSSENEMLLKVSDPDLDSRLKKLYRAESELEEILDDPFLEQTREQVSSMFKERDSIQKKKTREAARFIRNALSEDMQSPGEFKDFRVEISKNDINDLSAEWVRDWHKKKQMEAVPSLAEVERKSFIESSLKPEKTTIAEPLPLQPVMRKQSSRKLLRYSALAAAALLALFITLNTLVPSSRSEDIFRSFYAPYPEVTTVTRGMIGETATDALSSNALFFMGLTQIETGKTGEAIGNFISVINNSGSYVKEAQWYLGLAYLRNDDRKKAAECFKVLASSDGYYRKPAKKILRRLR